MQIEIDGIVYDVIIEKKNNKNTYLRVKEDLNIYVTTSYLTPNFAIKKFINSFLFFFIFKIICSTCFLSFSI